MCDLQLRKIITSSSELRFGYSWTLWKSHLVKIPSIFFLMAVGAGACRIGQVGKDRSGRSAREGLATHV